MNEFENLADQAAEQAHGQEPLVAEQAHGQEPLVAEPADDPVKKRTGQPLDDEKRRAQPLKDLILYGIKMTARRDQGGRTKVGSITGKLREDLLRDGFATDLLDTDLLAQDLVGLNAHAAAALIAERVREAALDAAEFADALVAEQLAGTRARQSRSIDELNRRLAELQEALNVAEEAANAGDHSEAYRTLRRGIEQFAGYRNPYRHMLT